MGNGKADSEIAANSDAGAIQPTPPLLLNGEAAPAAYWNRALLYGDGLFETLSWVGDAAPLWPLHWQRLCRGCHQLGLEPPAETQLLAECRALLQYRQSPQKTHAERGGDPVPGLSSPRCVIRLTVFRDSQGGRGYRPAGHRKTQRLLSLHPAPALEQPALSVGLSRIRLAQQPALAGLKHLNRLENVLAAAECEDHGWGEALMLDPQGYFISAVMGNILLRLADRDDGASEVWVTPPLDQCGIAGVTRQWLLEAAVHPIHIRAVHVDQLPAVRELWVMNSVMGLRAVTTLAGRELHTSATGRKLAAAVRQKLAGDPSR